MRSLIRRLPPQLSATGELTDERLLGDFLARSAAPQAAEEAFTAIVRRHGPMVRGVCRRVLRNDADADDAFQAVFVVLIRKANAVRPRSQLGNWLYGVAVNVARRGRDALSRRRTQERLVDVADQVNAGRTAGGELEQSDLRAVIDQELSGLPAAYRAAVIACDLEGATRAEAAGRLGWSEGTVASRLARGRAILADRLTRRGVVIPATGLLAMLGSNAAAVSQIPFHLLVSSSPPAVEALAMETMKAMTTSKLKLVTVVLFTAIGLAAAGTATVWACGGYGRPLRPNPPVSDAKPYPFQSVETTEAKPNESAIWNRPKPRDVPTFVDKPGADNAGVAKSALFIMTNPAKDIIIVSDRHEKFVEFFRRQPVMVAVVPANVHSKLLYGNTQPVNFDFVEKASLNEDGPRVAAYGASVKLAPLAANGPVFQLLDNVNPNTPVVFVRDESDKNLWHAVGLTRRSSVGFFAARDRVAPDAFAPADLLQEKPKSEK